MKQNDNLVKLAKITNTAASFLIFLAGLMLIFLPSTEVTSLQRTVLADRRRQNDRLLLQRSLPPRLSV